MVKILTVVIEVQGCDKKACYYYPVAYRCYDCNKASRVIASMHINEVKPIECT